MIELFGISFSINSLDFFNKRKALSKVNILFIDDEHEDFAIIKTLRESHEYGSVESMADLNHLDNTILKQADIIFLDIQGIGRLMSYKNGTSLVDAITTRYPKKIITIYSSKGIPKDTLVKSSVKTIPKNSSHEGFSSYIREVWQTKK